MLMCVLRPAPLMQQFLHTESPDKKGPHRGTVKATSPGEAQGWLEEPDKGVPGQTKEKLFLWGAERFFSLCSKKWLSGPHQMNHSIKRLQMDSCHSGPFLLAFS